MRKNTDNIVHRDPDIVRSFREGLSLIQEMIEQIAEQSRGDFRVIVISISALPGTGKTTLQTYVKYIRAKLKIQCPEINIPGDMFIGTDRNSHERVRGMFVSAKIFTHYYYMMDQFRNTIHSLVSPDNVDDVIMPVYYDRLSGTVSRSSPLRIHKPTDKFFVDTEGVKNVAVTDTLRGIRGVHVLNVLLLNDTNKSLRRALQRDTANRDTMNGYSVSEREDARIREYGNLVPILLKQYPPLSDLIIDLTERHRSQIARP